VDDKQRDITVGPSGGLKGEVTVPGDKSISHRAVILGSIAEGTTEVINLLEGEDNLRTIEAFRKMGISIEGPKKRRLFINGTGLYGLSEPGDIIDCVNSGTTARLLTGLLSAQPFTSKLTGDASLRKRPMNRVVRPLLMMGASITGRNGGEYLPLAITGSKLKGIDYKTPVASAQVKSALLLAALYAEGETVVEEPQTSRDHTERLLTLFGADPKVEGKRVAIRKTDSLRGCKIIVPGDISSAAFFIVGAIITPRSELLIKGVGVNPTRTGVIDILKKMGASVKTINLKEVSGEPVADILVKSSNLKGTHISAEELLPAIDEFPIICVAATLAEGKTTIEGAVELRVKESDRIAAMAGALKALRVTSEERPDGIVIEGPGATGAIKGGTINAHGDHRIAMAMAIAGLRSEKGVTIENADFPVHDLVDISFPGFFSLLNQAAMDQRVIDPRVMDPTVRKGKSCG
jgi:3-phosphoshikimate 1-carboxyvinyltransferase